VSQRTVRHDGAARSRRLLCLQPRTPEDLPPMRLTVICLLALAWLLPADGLAETDPARLIEQAEAARQVALASDADRLYPDVWEAAERRLREARAARERGNQARAVQRALEAREAFLAAELQAIEGRVLSRARAGIAEAQAARVDRYAPVTLDRARALLAQAEETLAEDRRAVETAATLATRAEALALHARALADAVQGSRARGGSVELALLAREEPLRRVAREAGVEQAEAGDPAALGQALIDHLTTLERRLARQESELADANQRILAMDEELREMDRQLGGVARERSELIMALEAQAQVTAQYARLEALFSREEAIVLREGERVIIRLVGLNFPTGSSTVTGDAEPLLARLAEAANIFPQARFTVEGHTDSRGSAQLNLRLSQDRAEAVVRHLVEAQGLSEFRLRAVGLGSSRPIASDDTEDGRARNRRIDVTFSASTPP
jgi:OmpA-OmpF porin, OOP family